MKSVRNALNSLALAAFVIGAAASGALAQDGGPPPGGGWTMGIFGFSSDTPYGFRDTAGAPLIEYENEYFKLGLPSTEVKLPWISNEQLSFGLTVDIFGSEGGYEASDATILHGMAERKSGVWAGATMNFRSEWVELSLKALGDLGGDSEGTSVEFEASHTFFVSDRFTISPKIGAVWLDDKTVDYYYGVRAGEATATRAAYTGEATVNVRLGVNFGYMLTERQMLMLDISATKLGSGITDSPIVVDDTVTSVGLGYMFRF